MIDLLAKTACDGALPITHRGVTLSELDIGNITSLMPYRTQTMAASLALHAVHGLNLPKPNRTFGNAECRVIWSGQGQAFLVGPKPDKSLGKTMALTDQTDAWAVLVIEGTAVLDVFARICPLDMRPAIFKRGHTARSLIGHMNASITRISKQSYQVMVFRSMAETAVHEITEAMKSVGAQ